jgi:DNA polymerase-3 subunit alpha
MLDQDLNKRVLESLIRAGAFDSMGIRRSQLLDAYEQLLDGLARNKRKNLEGQFDLFSLGQDTKAEPVELVLRNIPEFSLQDRMAMEKEITGLYLSGHPMDAYRDTARHHGAIAIGALLEGLSREDGPYQDGQRVLIAGVVSASRTRPTKNNSLMAYVTLEDDTGSMELLAFSRVLEESGGYLAVNQPILAQGRISIRDEKAPQLMVDHVTSLNQTPPPPPDSLPGRKLYLRLPGEDSPLFRRVKALFTLFPGPTPAVLYLADSKRRLGARCLLHQALVDELIELLGGENVVIT